MALATINGGVKNIFSCLVHEKPECVLDLVRNLRYTDPASDIILYNGGNDTNLLTTFPFEKYGAYVHPNPKRMKWGWLHPYALDVIEYANENFDYDVITFVDSDQLAVGTNYSSFIADRVKGNPNLGMFGNSTITHRFENGQPPSITALEEVDLWRPFLRRFPEGEQKYVKWTFWPSTVITRKAGEELIKIFAEDKQLKEILSKTKIWASEEVILPTLISLLGFDIELSPCSYEYVKYKKNYTDKDIKAVLAKWDAYWIHPIPRDDNNGLRKQIRSSFGNYARNTLSSSAGTESRFLLSSEIINSIKNIEGWLSDKEADLLIQAAAKAVTSFDKKHALVEVGSYCGKTSVLIGLVKQRLAAEHNFFAIDSHEGLLGSTDSCVKDYGSSYDKMMRNLNKYGINESVSVVKKNTHEAEINEPVSFLLIDGLHDYYNTARNFYHFEKQLARNAIIAFHDYADYYPGVITFVDELISQGNYSKLDFADSLIILQKKSTTTADTAPSTYYSRTDTDMPLISCIMPTADRRDFVVKSIGYFLNQDYPNKELVIVDDGDDNIRDVIPADEQIRYFRIKDKMNLGAKRNYACELAEGSIIQHWDDDDWMAPHWLSTQVNTLTLEDADVTGLKEILFYNKHRNEGWQYVYYGTHRQWVYGGTLCYKKDLWQRNKFDEIRIGEDNKFVWSNAEKSIAVNPNKELYVAFIHDNNTSTKITKGTAWHKYPVESIKLIMSGEVKKKEEVA